MPCEKRALRPVYFIPALDEFLHEGAQQGDLFGQIQRIRIGIKSLDFFAEFSTLNGRVSA